ncbi:MAG: helix-turn-helix domain-containing protein, partial [Pseudomonadota bacterium]|nr:helix-turn-helix domain-containing protein [Pseudomonadota bacterium]
VAEGRFREDLYHRIKVLKIEMPALRKRAMDIKELTLMFIQQISRALGIEPLPLNEGVLLNLSRYDWPGNVRELRNFAQRLAHRSMVMTPGEPVVFDPAALDPFESPWRPASSPGKPTPKPISPLEATPGRIDPSVTADFQAQVAAFEMRLIDEALSWAKGHQGQAADALGLTYHQFRGLLKKHGYSKGAGKPQPPPRKTPIRSM